MKDVRLLEGSPAKALGKLALPIMGTSFVQMAYNITDMFWIGWLGSSSVAAVGSAGMFLWFSDGFSLVPRLGGQVICGQALGEGDLEKARRSVRAAVQIGIILGLLFSLASVFLRGTMISVFALNETRTVAEAELYLAMVSFGFIPSFLARILTGILTAGGNSHTPFRVTVVGLILNMVLDPLMIFVFGWGVAGAAVATAASQTVVCLLFLLAIRKNDLFVRLRLFERVPARDYRRIFAIGLPSGFQTLFYSSASMLLSRLVASFGDAAVAVQRVGGQIESLAWMTADGMSTSVNAFTAQNYGARNVSRLRQGYRTALLFSTGSGALSMLTLFIWPKSIMGLFFHEPEVVLTGATYLWVVAFSQVFMSVEITTAGAFSGYGQTLIPSTVISIFTILRLPLAYALSRSALGLRGIWWAVSASSIAKGCVLCVWFLVYEKRRLRTLSGRV